MLVEHQGQRREPAAPDARAEIGLNGWLPFAEALGWAFETPAPGRIAAVVGGARTVLNTVYMLLRRGNILPKAGI